MADQLEAPQTVTIPIDFLTELLNIRREHRKVCRTFRILEKDMSHDWVGNGINERISQYVTSYVIRKTIAEKEVGAAFRDPVIPPLSVPEIEDPTNHEK